MPPRNRASPPPACSNPGWSMCATSHVGGPLAVPGGVRTRLPNGSARTRAPDARATAAASRATRSSCRGAAGWRLRRSRIPSTRGRGTRPHPGGPDNPCRLRPRVTARLSALRAFARGMGDEDRPLVHNYIVERGLSARLPKRILFWDETMRDGEQTPGVSFSPEEKLRIATTLSEMGVHIMDVGIPVVSKEEARGIRMIANAGLKASIMAACRAVRKDVGGCIECEVDEGSIFIACSDLHLKYKLNMTREEVLEAAVGEVEFAKAHGVKVTFVTEDTFRADMDYVTQLYNACIDAGAERVVLSDTIGIMTPTAISWYLGEIRKRFKPAQLSVHLHNDFGMAVANSL